MRKLIIIGLLATSAWGCQQKTEKQVPTTEPEKPQHEHVLIDGASQELSLNNGDKWLVNEEMRPFVKNGSDLIIDFDKAANKDAKVLATKLTEQNEQIVKSCTMTGKGHEELHKWLLPHMELVKSLGNSTDSVETANLIGQLQQSYSLYNQYFK